MEPHYICEGECHGVSGEPGTCQDKNCSLYGEELLECDCGDAAAHTEETGDDETDETDDTL